ncbi:aflatoxin B1 aldehyde reductase member 2 [Thecamonas trahens ATCC 50062]|uniref:Aflatoxin B1 aldehyde reductase member 2 n=1 Tax=Thecamonas trahens ATCC 50062 TaxID=461836 RepID=A0A0L0DNM4_THETB|nr:aflatoxin B1 aldehyde reductase member 2 [Thecamonas trahens ATCC 50062]KNC53909.1 aflatoxin B1 aldehyde reductase member 2 [Thecamonas trahens ATCC 50062]|eukprot:XP_013754115.1 aflatoxin B1 aldehyde reductase member 2 [Thecamonas trahens ATCC 50062]
MSTTPHALCPRLVLGTMAMGGQADQDESASMVAAFAEAGGTEVDTAIMYNMGKTHEVLAPIVASHPGLKVATKVNPWYTNYETFAPRGGLAADQVEAQASASLAALGMPAVDILYLHAPDQTTPIEETLQAMDKLHKAGVFSEFGLSNYAAWEVVRIVGLCEAAGYVKPTVYQGMYNAFTRGVEAELLPAIRACGMRFYAYNITAGGLLTGKHTKDSDPTDGRFNKDTLWGRAYRQRFFNDTMFSALEALKAALAALDGEPISPYAAVIRYLAFHSKLTPDDGLILGGSCAKHIEVNAASLRDGPLPQSIVDVIDSAAEATTTVCPPYFRGHSNCAADA